MHTTDGAAVGAGNVKFNPLGPERKWSRGRRAIVVAAALCPGAHAESSMSITSVAAAVLFASWGCLMTGCGEEHPAPSRETFDGATAAYYCEYYEIAIGEALEPGMEIDEERAEDVRATVRNTSRIWSSTFRDRLALDGTRFALHFTVIPWPPKGDALADARPQGRRHVVYEGTWSRSESLVTLKVDRVDGRDAREPFELTGHWRGGEVEIRGARVDSAFSRSILWKRGVS